MTDFVSWERKAKKLVEEAETEEKKEKEEDKKKTQRRTRACSTSASKKSSWHLRRPQSVAVTAKPQGVQNKRMGPEMTKSHSEEVRQVYTRAETTA